VKKIQEGVKMNGRLEAEVAKMRHFEFEIVYIHSQLRTAWFNISQLNEQKNTGNEENWAFHSCRMKEPSAAWWPAEKAGL
jgi:hypothetical protein